MWKRGLAVAIVLGLWAAGMGVFVTLNSRPPAWRFSTIGPDPMTDETVSVARLDALSGGDQLVLQCRSGKDPELALSVGWPVTPNRAATGVLMRYDQLPVESRTGNYNKDAIFVTIDSVMRGKLRAAKKLTMEYKAVGGSEVIARFDLANFSEAYERVTAPPCGKAQSTGSQDANW